MISRFAKGDSRKSFSHMLSVVTAFVGLTIVLFYCPEHVIIVLFSNSSICIFFL